MFFDIFTFTDTKKERITKDLNDLSKKSIDKMFSTENLEKKENRDKLFSKDESVKKKVKEDFEKQLRAQLNEDNKRYIKKDELNNYCEAEIKKKSLEFEDRLKREEEKIMQKKREEEIKELNSRIGR